MHHGVAGVTGGGGGGTTDGRGTREAKRRRCNSLWDVLGRKILLRAFIIPATTFCFFVAVGSGEGGPEDPDLDEACSAVVVVLALLLPPLPSRVAPLLAVEGGGEEERLMDADGDGDSGGAGVPPSDSGQGKPLLVAPAATCGTDGEGGGRHSFGRPSAAAVLAVWSGPVRVTSVAHTIPLSCSVINNGMQ